MTWMMTEKRTWVLKTMRETLRWLPGICGSLIVILTVCLPAAAKDQLCFPNLQWYSLVNNNTPPVIDGNIAGDPGWNGAFRYVFGDTNTPDVIVQGVRDSTNTNLYISIQAENMLDWDPDNFVVLAFNPGGGAAQQALVLQPVPSGASSAAASAPGAIQYYLGTAPFSSQATPWPTPPLIMTGFATSGTNYQWYMEAKFPIDPTGHNGINVPTSGTFGFYADIVRITNETPADAPGSGPGAESTWPSVAPGLNCTGNPGFTCEPAQGIPVATDWGTATIDPTVGCQGVSVTTQVGNIYTNHGTSITGYGTEPAISLTQPNIFSAYVQNTSVDNAGNPIAAPGVNATFKIANFGIPGPNSWIIPGTEPGGSPIANDNPAGPISLPATTCQGAANNNNPSCTISTGAWNLNASEQSAYDTPSTLHQCVQVVLDANPGAGNNVVFLNNTATQNMNFLPPTPGPMSRIAEISAKGYELPNGMTDQLFDIGVMARTETIKARDEAAVTNQGSSSQLIWEAHGCRHTNNFVTVLKHKIALCQSVGGFGFIAQANNATTLEQWAQSLSGSGLSKVKDNVYSVHIPKDGVARVTTTIAQVPNGPGKSGHCGITHSSGAAIFLLSGLFLVGFVSYRPSKDNRKERL